MSVLERNMHGSINDEDISNAGVERGESDRGDSVCGDRKGGVGPVVPATAGATKQGRFSKLHKIGVGGFVIRPSTQRMLTLNPQAAIECK
jgi:hypothetical protein